LRPVFFALNLQWVYYRGQKTGQAKRSLVLSTNPFLELGFFMEIFDYDNILLLPRK
jgi:hypothetical protein